MVLKAQQTVRLENMVQQANPIIRYDRQQLLAIKSSMDGFGLAEVAEDSSITYTRDELFSLERLTRMAQSSTVQLVEPKIVRPDANELKVVQESINIPIQLDAGSNGRHNINASANVSLKLSVDLTGIGEALKIEDNEKRIEQLRRHINLSSSHCELTFK